MPAAWGDEDQRRTLRLIDRMRERVPEILARRCGWCLRWFSTRDFILAHAMNAQTTHGICKVCSAKMAADPNYRGVGSPPSAA